MQNILQLQDDLKNFSEQQLVREMQMPSGQVPQFLVLSELGRRKRIKNDFARQQAADTPTVAEETVAAAGIPQAAATGIAQSMAPKTSVTENTGIDTMMPKQPTRMADGGVVKANEAGFMQTLMDKRGILGTRLGDKFPFNALGYGSGESFSITLAHLNLHLRFLQMTLTLANVANGWSSTERHIT